MEAIGKGTDRRDLSRLDACMQKRDNTGLPPTACNSLKIVFKVPKNDVTVAVNQCGRRHQDLKRAFRSILQVTRNPEA